MGNLDFGEMFLNFILHERIQVYCRVDLAMFFPEEVGEKVWNGFHHLYIPNHPGSAAQGRGDHG